MFYSINSQYSSTCIFDKIEELKKKKKEKISKKKLSTVPGYYLTMKFLKGAFLDGFFALFPIIGMF